MLNKIICFILLQIFLINNICFAADNFAERNNLAPVVNISSSDMLSLFASIVDLEKGLNKADQAIADLSKADNLNQGYEKLSLLIEKIAQTKQYPLIICFDGSGSAGKSTIFKLIKKNGIADIQSKQIEFLSIDRIAIDLLSMGDYSMRDALLEMPVILVDKISRAKREKKLIMIDGMESFDIISMIYGNKLVPDIAVIMKVSEKIRLKRDLMRFGLFAGLKLFESRRHEPNPLKGSIPLIINNDQEHVSNIRFVFRTVLRTITATFEYVLPEFLVEFFIDKQAYIVDKIDLLKSKYSELDMVGLVMRPFDCCVFGINKLRKFLLITHKPAVEQKQGKQPEAVFEKKVNLRVLDQNLVKRIKRIRVLIKAGEILPAAREFKTIAQKSEQLDPVRAELVLALKDQADYLFEKTDYAAALTYYQEIIKVAAHETEANFYIGACYLMQGDNLKALQYITLAKNFQPHSPIYILISLMLKAGEVFDRIEGYDLNILLSQQQEDLTEYDKLSEVFSYLLDNYAEAIDVFSQSNPVNNMILREISAIYYAKLEKMEIVFKKRKLRLKNSGLLIRSEVFPNVESVSVLGERINVDFKLRTIAGLNAGLNAGLIAQAI